MSQPTESQSAPAPLDADAAFVVHLTGADPANPAAASGRAEHVTTGRSLRFSSMSELRGFMQALLAQSADLERRQS